MSLIIETIGATGRNRATIQLWEDNVPDDVVASGNSYEGRCYNDGMFAAAEISAHNCDSSHTMTLTAAAGHSFQDDASVRTNPLSPDQAKGVMIETTSTYGYCIQLNGVSAYLTISRLQMRVTQASSSCLVNIAGIQVGAIVKDCILESVGAPVYAWQTDVYNVVSIVTGSINDIHFPMLGTHTITGLTLVRRTNNSTTGTGVSSGNYSDITLKSCAIFGFTAAVGTSGSGVFNAASSNNATDAASGLPGSSNQHSVTFSSTTPFTQASNTGTDLKPIASTALAANGYKDATNAPNDISAYARSATPTIGAWELASGPTVSTTDGKLIIQAA